MYILVHKSLNKMLIISLGYTLIRGITESKVVDILKTQYIHILFFPERLCQFTTNSLYGNGCLIASSAAMRIIIYYLANIRDQN